MNPKRLVLRILPPKQRMPVEYGLFVEAFVFASLVIQDTASSPMPDELDEIDWYLLSNGVRPSSLRRAPLKAISALLDRYADFPEQQALSVRCQAILDLLPHLPEDHILGDGEKRFLHMAALEAAAQSPLDSSLQFVRSNFYQAVRQAIPRYPPAQDLLTGELLGLLQKRFAGLLRNDLYSIALNAPALAVQYQGEQESRQVSLSEAPLRQGLDQAAQIANRFIALKWLVEADAQTLIEAGIGQHIFKQTAIQEILTRNS